MSNGLFATGWIDVGIATMRPAVEARWSWGLIWIIQCASGLGRLMLALLLLLDFAMFSVWMRKKYFETVSSFSAGNYLPSQQEPQGWRRSWLSRKCNLLGLVGLSRCLAAEEKTLCFWHGISAWYLLVWKSVQIPEVNVDKPCSVLGRVAVPDLVGGLVSCKENNSQIHGLCLRHRHICKD